MRSNRKCVFVLRCSTAVGTALALASSPAFAAEDQPGTATEAQAASEAPSDIGLGEIIVTAQKRSESLQRAAIAITAVSGDDLQRSGVTDAQQLTNHAPALQISNAYGPTNNFYLRGVGNFVVNVSSDPAVIVNLDGVPLGRPTGVQGMFFDLERVEVLKGPQGTLYGRNATGGAINVITAQPKLDELSGYANFSYGNYDAVKADAALNVPIGDQTAIRIAAMLSRRDGTYSDGTGDEDLKAVRITLASQLTDNLKVTLGGDFAHMGGIGPGSTFVGLDFDERIGLYDPRASGAFLLPAPGGLPFPTGFAPVPGTLLQPYNLSPFQDNDFWGLRLQADLETSIGTLSVIPAYREAKLSYLVTSGPSALTREKDKQASVEVRLVSPSTNRLQYILGAFYFNERDNSLNDFNFQYLSFVALIRPKTDSYAGYARLTYSLTPELRISGGVRYTIDRRSTDDLNHIQQVICTVPSCAGTPTLPVQFEPVTNYAGPGTLIAVDQPNTGRKTFKKATWRAGVEYDAGPRSLLYATVESGYKSGGFFNTPDQANNSFEPETIVAYTIGAKNRFLNNRLQVNVEAFWWQYSDQQVSHFFNVGGVPVFGTENIGKSRFRGIEVEARAQVLQNTEINATVQYLDARNTDYTYQNSLPPNTGCPVAPALDANGNPVFQVDCSGRRPANTPVWTLQGGIQQRIPLGETGDLTFTVNSRYQSGSYAGTELLAAQYQKGFSTTDVQLEYATPDKRFTVAGFANNLEDNNTIGFAQPHNLAPGAIFVNLRMPRTYGARVGFKF